MARSVLLALLAGTLPGTAAADTFAEIAGGFMAPGGSDTWVNLGNESPKLAVRAGTMDRKWTDHVVSVDWTPIRTDAAGTSAHRFRAIGSFSFNVRAGMVNLSLRTGVGFDFLRVNRPSASDTLIGYAFEVGAGMWIATGPVEIGGDIALPFALNGNATVGDLELDSYVSIDVDALLGVRYVWR